MGGTSVPHADVPIVNNNDKSTVGSDLDAKVSLDQIHYSNNQTVDAYFRFSDISMDGNLSDKRR